MTTTDQLIIRPVANGFLVENLSSHSCNTMTPDKDRYVFNDPDDLAGFIRDFYLSTKPKDDDADNPYLKHHQ